MESCKVVLTFKSLNEILYNATIRVIKATEQYFHKVLFISCEVLKLESVFKSVV